MAKRPPHSLKWPLTPSQAESVNEMFEELYREHRRGLPTITEFTGILTVDHGGTGVASFTPYTVITGGTTATGPLQNVVDTGTSGQFLTSNGAGALPTWSTFSASTIILRGTRASQPAATAVTAGTIYYVTDEFKTERSNATSWETFDDYNSSGNKYYFGTISAAFPMLIRNAVDIDVKLADASAFTDIEGAQIRANGAINDSGLGFQNTVQSDSFSANFLLRRSRDNAGSPEALQTGDFIAAMVCQGHDGTNYGPTNNGAVIFAATENYTTSAKGTAIILATTTTGTTTRTNRWQVGGTGHFESINGTEMIKWGTTTSFPALKRSSAELQVRLGDDSDYAELRAMAINATRTTTPAAAGSSSAHTLVRTTAGDAGGTSVISSLNANLGITGTASVSQARALGFDVNNDLSSGSISTHEGILITNRLRGAGSSGLVFGLRAILEFTSTGNITDRYEAFRANTPTKSSTGTITGFVRGLQISDMGGATGHTTVDGINVDNQTKGSGNATGIRLQVASASGKWNLFADGTAQNHMAGNLGVGSSTTVPGYTIEVTSAGDIGWTSRSQMESPSDGIITLLNAAGTSWTRLQLGGTTSSFPAIKRSGTIVAMRLADDSDYAPLEAKYAQIEPSDAFLFRTRSRIESAADGNIELKNAAGTAFSLLKFGGTSSSFPAIKRSSAILQLRLADDTDFTDLTLKNVVGQTGYTEMTEMTAPSAPAANLVRIYAEDDGAGKTRLMALFSSGSAVQIAIQP